MKSRKNNQHMRTQFSMYTVYQITSSTAESNKKSKMLQFLHQIEEKKITCHWSQSLFDHYTGFTRCFVTVCFSVYFKGSRNSVSIFRWIVFFAIAPFFQIKNSREKQKNTYFQHLSGKNMVEISGSWSFVSPPFFLAKEAKVRTQNSILPPQKWGQSLLLHWWDLLDFLLGDRRLKSSFWGN